MEAASEPNSITSTDETYSLIKDDFLFRERGEFEIKGFGTKRLYWSTSTRITADAGPDAAPGRAGCIRARAT